MTIFKTIWIIIWYSVRNFCWYRHGRNSRSQIGWQAMERLDEDLACCTTTAESRVAITVAYATMAGFRVDGNPIPRGVWLSKYQRIALEQMRAAGFVVGL